MLAADRKTDDPVARAAGVTSKALSLVAGEPMILRVLRALERSVEVDEIIICGPPHEAVAGNQALRSAVDDGYIRWIPPASTPSTSTYAALKTLPEEQIVLITTADHALLSSEIVDHFCAAARHARCDLAFALAPHDSVEKAHPGVRRTVLKFRDGGYCSCNLFAFMTARSREAADYWRQVERERKHPWKIARTLGWLTVLRYVLGRLSLDDVLRLASKRLGMQVGAVVMPFPQAAIDVDTVADWEFVKTVVEPAHQPIDSIKETEGASGGRAC